MRFSDAEQESLIGYHAVIVNSLGELPPTVVQKLEAYVREGGGLWLMLGSQIDRDDFNRHWYSDGAGLCPTALRIAREAGRPRQRGGGDPPAR